MHLDTMTVLVLNGVVVALCGVLFILNTAFHGNDSVGRIWSMAFIAAIVVTIAHGSSMAGQMIWWAIVAANVALAIAVGSVWAGLRCYNGRSSGLWVVAVISALVFAATLLHGEPAGQWAGATELWISVALMSVFGAIEAMRGRLRRKFSGRMLAATLWIAAAAAIMRAVVFAADGATGTVFVTYLNTGNFSVLSLCLIVLITVAASTLRAEHASGGAPGDLTVGMYSESGVLTATAFVQAASDHVKRAKHSEAGLALIGADIDNLPEINVAFGRGAGEEAIVWFAAQLRLSAPVLSVIGHQASGRFLMLVNAASVVESCAVAERVRATLVDGPLKEASQIRLTASFGIADTFDHGYTLTALMVAVSAAIDGVKVNGGNDIAVPPATTVPLE